MKYCKHDLKWHEKLLKNDEGKVVIVRKNPPGITFPPQEYVPAFSNHKQEISLKGRANHRKVMLRKKYI